jgi:hypothetical protein
MVQSTASSPATFSLPMNRPTSFRSARRSSNG